MTNSQYLIDTLMCLQGYLLEEADAQGGDIETGLLIAVAILQEEIDLEQEHARIASMTKEEVLQFLYSKGYTQEQLDASFAKLMATLEKSRKPEAKAKE